jgi:hypothetical protein
MINNKMFLPEVTKEGHVGFYPTKPEEWKELPLPMQCSTSYPVNGNYIVGVIFNVWFDEYGMKAKVELHPENVFKALWCAAYSKPTFHEVSQVRWADGTVSFAKWYQDTKTGAYEITVGCNGTKVLVQGGYLGHIPSNCVLEESGEWGMNSCSNDRCYSCLI